MRCQAAYVHWLFDVFDKGFGSSGVSATRFIGVVGNAFLNPSNDELICGGIVAIGGDSL